MDPSPTAPAGTAAPPTERSLPSGTVTFLFTDIEGSTGLLQRLGGEYAGALADHNRLIGQAVEARGGSVFGHEGDAVFAAFTDAASAVAAAVDAQRRLAAHGWPGGERIAVRMGIHTGEAVATAAGYVGLPLHQVARIAATAHGGQIVVSAAARALSDGTAVGQGIAWRDLGEHHLRDLPRPERLSQVLAPGLPGDFPPLRSTPASRGNLPVELTSFVGRRELAEARRLLATTRLLTLTGPGGTGKTRLALRLAAEVADEFPDGTWFVALDAVSDASLVPSAIAQALQVPAGAGPPLDRTVRALRDRRALLVLDNFEQVVEAAPAVSTLLASVPGLKIVVTSRVLLRMTAEQQFDVPTLGLPASPAEAGESDAVRLFVERGAAVVPTFALTDANAPAITQVVTRVDGLPLAIELAAARLRLLPVEALADRLDRRLAVLTGGARDRPARQQTLRGAIDWSYDLLDAPDRRLFERLGVFAGGVSLEQAEQVCGPAQELGREVLDGLGSLIDKSLLRAVPGVGHEPRFAMLATIREYAAERLAAGGEAAGIGRRHAAVYLDLAERSAPHLTGGDAETHLDRLALDHDNLRLAVEWATGNGEAGIAHRLGTALWRFWQVRGHLEEARERLARIVAMPGADDLPPRIRVPALGAAGSIAYWRGDRAATWSFYQAALAQARAAGDTALLAEALTNAGFEPEPDSAAGSGTSRYGRSHELFEEAIGLYRELGDDQGLAGATWALGISELSRGNRTAAREHFEQSAELYRRLGAPFGQGWALHMLGLVDVLDGDVDAGEARFRAAARIFRASRDIPAAVIMLLDATLVARRRGEESRFWTLAGATDAWSVRSGAHLGSNLEEFIDLERPTRPADPQAAAWWDAGAAMSLDDALDLGFGPATAPPAPPGPPG